MSTTIQEKQFNRAAKNWLKAGRRTSYILNYQSGFNDVMGGKQFDAGTYNSDTQSEANADSVGAPNTTRQVDPAEQGFGGDVPREGNVDPAWKAGLDDAITHIGRAIDNIGDDRSPGLEDGLNVILSTMQALRQLPDGVDIRKAVANKDGVTRPPLLVNSNSEESVPGIRSPYVSVADLENAARKQTQLTSRIVNVERL